MVENFNMTMEGEHLFGTADVFNVRWNIDGSALAIGTSNGFVNLNTPEFEQIRGFNCQSGAEKMPITSIRFRPEMEIARRPVLLVTTCDGGVLHWNLANGKNIHTVRLSNEQIYASDYNFDGSRYLLGCKDGNIKQFDEETFTQIGGPFRSYEDDITGAQRVFCLKWFDENLFLSGGWDNKITIWDIRTTSPCREMFGPHICGDSVDIRDNYIVSGSYGIREQVQVWALDSGRNIHTLTLDNHGRKCMAYAAQFCKNEGTVFAVGGQGSEEIYFFDAVNLNLVSTISKVPKTVYSMHRSANNKLALGIGNSARIYSMT